jgi:PEP-CTERM motif
VDIATEVNEGSGTFHFAVAGLQQRMSHEAKLGLLARPLAIEPRFWIGRRGVRLVGALLPWKSDSRFLPSPASGSPGPSLGRKLFIEAQSLDRNYAGLDNVDLELGKAVPEPSTWMMVLLGFAGLGFVGYRHRHALAGAASV